MDDYKNNINATYKPASKDKWTGRNSSSTIENQYWHQEIKFLDVSKTSLISNIDIAILGYVCDEGVRRNQGRIGANKGPDVIREKLAKLPIHFEGTKVADVGDIVCANDAMEACQGLFSKNISNLIQQNILPIAIGGGHDIAYGHFMGIWNVLKDTNKRKVGIINFDAHFDLRPVETKGNSGTPFNQIISELAKTGDAIDYFAIGIQQQSNTKELFNIAKESDVKYAFNYECEDTSTAVEALKARLVPFIEKVDYLYITIDMDGFSSAYAPGVSAPSPLGFSPSFVFKTLAFLLNTKKVISLDIAELNPSLDRDNQTANLAAKIIDFIVLNY